MRNAYALLIQQTQLKRRFRRSLARFGGQRGDVSRARNAADFPREASDHAQFFKTRQIAFAQFRGVRGGRIAVFAALLFQHQGTDLDDVGGAGLILFVPFHNAQSFGAVSGVVRFDADLERIAVDGLRPNRRSGAQQRKKG